MNAGRERASSLVAHHGEVPRVVEVLVDVSHLGTQERALGRAIYVAKEI